MTRNEYTAQVKRALEWVDRAHIVLTDEEIIREAKVED